MKISYVAKELLYLAWETDGYDRFYLHVLEVMSKLNVPFKYDKTKTRLVAQACYEIVTNYEDHAWAKNKDIQAILTFEYTDAAKLLTIQYEDNGMGVPARYQNDLNIYQQPIEQELKIFAEALTPAKSSKIKTQDCVMRGEPGYGFTNLFSAAKKLQAWLNIRSGRCQANTEEVLPVGDFLKGTRIVLNVNC